MKNRSRLLLVVSLVCCVGFVTGQNTFADTSKEFEKSYDSITAGFHKRLSTHPAGVYGGHVIGVNDAENPLDDHTTPRADQLAGFNASLTLGYIETGFGATTFIGEYAYTARDNLTVDFLTLTNEPANQVDLPMQGPECQRRLYTDTLYEALSGGFPPQDAIYKIKVSQEPEPPGGANNAGGFIRMTPSIYLSTWNKLDDYYVCVGCTNGTKLNLGGDPVRLSQGVMVLEVKTVANGGTVKIYDGNTLLIDGTGTKEWPLSGTFRMENVPSPLRVVGKTASANKDDVQILYKYMWGSEVWTVATEKMTVLKVEIAMDGNRDDSITFGDTNDNHYLFWVNNDHDQREILQTELTWGEDDTVGSPDCDNNTIGNSTIGINACKRDLEDFTRLHIFVDDITVNMPGITYWLKFENSSENPAVNIFQAVGESSAYLSKVSVADVQIQEPRLLTVDNTEQQLPNQYVKTGNQVSPFILEGKHKGTGDLTVIVKKGGNEICRKSVLLEMHNMPWFYDVYSVGVTSGDRWEVQIPTTATHTQTASYTPATDEKVLLVHGWNMTDTEKVQWVETMFKRLWWQGYQGAVIGFNWPTLADMTFWDMTSGFHHFDNSEFRSWLSSDALVSVFDNLNVSGKLRVLAHSMGNVVTGEAIHDYTGTQLHTYLACQAAVSGHFYDNTLSTVLSSPATPNVIGHFPDAIDDSEYFSGNCIKVSTRVNYFNEDDWALNLWEVNNGMKPVGGIPYWFGYQGSVTSYLEGTDRFFRSGLTITDYSVFVPVRDRVTIFSYMVQSRSKALGQTTVLSLQFEDWNLKTEMSYDGAHYSHSKEFRSTICEQWNFWKKVRQDCMFVCSY